MVDGIVLRRNGLRPGDVLLARGSGRLGSPISDWICRLDGGSYSHAALWDGDSVLEASGDGGKIRATSLAKLIEEHEYTHVYRFVRGARMLGDRGWDADAIVNVARSHLGAEYPYGALCLLGVLIGMGRLSGVPRAQELIRSMGDSLIRALREWRSVPCGRAPMTCAQFVGLAFWEADPTHERRYGLVVPYEPSALLRSSSGCVHTEPPSSCQWTLADAELLAQITEECRRTLLRDAPWLARGSYRDPSRGHAAVRALGLRTQEVCAGDRGLPLSCVTPRDLEHSPSLRRLGGLV